MKILNQIETVRIEIARLTALIQELSDQVRLIEAREAMSVNESERLHQSAVIVRLDSVKEYFAQRKTLRESIAQRSILKAQLERLRGEFQLELLKLKSELPIAEQQEMF